jgi:hypothetical protein
MGDFVARIDELLERVGDGRLRGEVRVDQVYAAYQHFRKDLRHRVGNAEYLSRPLNTEYRSYFQSVADHVLEPAGPVHGMVVATESLANSAATQTPVDQFNLARSQAVTVRDQGAVAYHRDARQRRLSEAELRALHRGRRRRR